MYISKEDKGLVDGEDLIKDSERVFGRSRKDGFLTLAWTARGKQDRGCMVIEKHVKLNDFNGCMAKVIENKQVRLCILFGAVRDSGEAMFFGKDIACTGSKMDQTLHGSVSLSRWMTISGGQINRACKYMLIF